MATGGADLGCRLVRSSNAMGSSEEATPEDLRALIAFP